MTQASKGLYATRLVDLTFTVMALGSATLLINGGTLSMSGVSGAQANPAAGLYLFAMVTLIAIASCIAHVFDRRGWDDYMGQVVSQSALIGMVTVLLTGPLFDFLIAPNFALRAPDLMIQGMVPIAAFAWSVGYAFLRWKGTNT